MKKNYINNKDFYAAIVEYYEKGEKDLSKYLVECFIEMTRRLAHKKNFRYYSYVEDMKQEALVSCVKALRNRKFTLDRTNPFAYFTTVIHNSYLIYLNKENKQIKIIEKQYTDKRDELYTTSGNDIADTNMKDYIDDYYQTD